MYGYKVLIFPTALHVKVFFFFFFFFFWISVVKVRPGAHKSALPSCDIYT